MMKLLFAFILLKHLFCQKDELSIDILPSDRYRLNKRDINHLKSDIERQVTLIVI
jgi:hypothetical protein